MFIAYVDQGDGRGRESWSFFYGDMFVGVTELEARTKAEAFVAVLKAEEPDLEVNIAVREAQG